MPVTETTDLDVAMLRLERAIGRHHEAERELSHAFAKLVDCRLGAEKALDELRRIRESEASDE